MSLPGRSATPEPPPLASALPPPQRRPSAAVRLPGSLAFVSLLFAALAACDPAADACATMCVAAQDRFEACLDEGGLSYGASVGYESAADYANACETFAWELRELGQADTCAARRATFEDGTCSDYHDAWEVE